jgi:hypothetical protein
MRLTVDVELAGPADAVAPWVDDLTAYPAWMGLVHKAEPVPAGDDGDPAWNVELRARVGPLARSKQLRMVRIGDPARPAAAAAGDGISEIRFVRRELDGKSHGQWDLTATITPNGATTRLTVELRYEGRMWTGVLEPILRDEIERSRERLRELVMDGRMPTSPTP